MYIILLQDEISSDSLLIVFFARILYSANIYKLYSDPYQLYAMQLQHLRYHLTISNISNWHHKKQKKLGCFFFIVIVFIACLHINIKLNKHRQHHKYLSTTNT